MGNILAIAQKEVKAYFESPIAYIVIGVFALLFGYFFAAGVSAFAQQSMQMQTMGGGGPMNLNQMLVYPLFMNMSVVLLFILPSITMRTYAEEKRSGTIELLLTSPLTDFQIIMGKFLGALALYALILAVTGIHVAILFAFGDPELMPILTTYLGLLLMGGCFLSVGLLISSLTRNQIVAMVVTFGVFLLLWVIEWFAQFVGQPAQDVLTYLSITGHLEEFTRGILDTKHLVYYVSFIAFGLFLTSRAVETARWQG